MNQGSQGSNRPYRRPPSRSSSSSSNRPSHERSQGGQGHHRRPGSYFVSHSQEVVSHATRRLANHTTLGILILSILAGGLLTLGAYFGLTLATESTSPVMHSLFFTIGLSTGLLIILGLNAILFTEPNVIMPYNLYNITMAKGFARLFKFWIIAWIGNLLGAWAFAWIIKLGTSYSAESITLLRTYSTDHLVKAATGASMGYFELFFSGILANWVLGFALVYGSYNRAAVGKILVLLLCVGMIVVTNLQAFPFNLAYFSILQVNHAGTQSFFDLIVNNLIPISLGNLVGGSFFVSLPLLFQTQKGRAR